MGLRLSLWLSALAAQCLRGTSAGCSRTRTQLSTTRTTQCLGSTSRWQQTPTCTSSPVSNHVTSSTTRTMQTTSEEKSKHNLKQNKKTNGFQKRCDSAHYKETPCIEMQVYKCYC